jgi:hypothetical protein
VQFGKFRPGNRDHFCRGVEFHGAGAQRDHRPAEQASGYLQMIGQLSQWLVQLTGYDALCMQPNSGRVQFGKFRPGNRDHFCRGVEFHGAGAQRDHRLIQRR